MRSKLCLWACADLGVRRSKVAISLRNCSCIKLSYESSRMLAPVPTEPALPAKATSRWLHLPGISENCAVPEGTHFRLPRYPGLTPWANFVSPCGLDFAPFVTSCLLTTSTHTRS